MNIAHGQLGKGVAGACMVVQSTSSRSIEGMDLKENLDFVKTCSKTPSFANNIQVVVC